MSKIHLYDVCVKYPDLSVSTQPSVQAAPNRSVSGMFGGIFKGIGGNRSANRIGMTTGSPIIPPREEGRQFILDHVNLEIAHGETMGILGPSGCGKTTLLRAISGLAPIDSGMITYDDEDVAGVPVGDRGIGIVFQNYALYPTMNSRENVGFFFRMHKRDEEIPERIKYVSKVMGIGFDELLYRRPSTLSGGQRQRVALARCIARDPKLFLFDEPLSNLDAKLRVQTRAELKRLITRFKVTGIYVTHDQIEAFSLCDKIAIMNEGKVVQSGTLRYLLDHPLTTLVASFLGTPPMNLLDGELTEHTWQNGTVTINLGSREIAPRANVTIGIRAEAFHLDPDGPLRGEVSLVEPLMAERINLVYLDLPPLKDRTRPRLAIRLPLDHHVTVGEWLSVSVQPDQVHLFDTRSGKRLG
jgi:ABC-type sugar transport system ATPase subunit